MNRKRNVALAQAIEDSGWKQFRIAEKAGLTEQRLSQIKAGRTEPTPAEQRALAKVLRKPVSQMFHVVSVGDEAQLAQASDKSDG